MLWMILVGVAMLRQRAIVWDDPYILMRYAENLVGGHGWSLNRLDQTDNAITSPLTVFLLGLLRITRMSMFAATAVLHLVLTATAAHLSWRTLRDAGMNLGALAAGVFVATSPAFTLMWGMETSLYLAVFALVLGWAGKPDRQIHSSVAVGLLGLVRPEAVVVGALAFAILRPPGELRVAGLRRLATIGGLMALPTALWMSVQYLWLGQFVPSTLAAKRAQTESGLLPVFGTWKNIIGRWPWDLRGQIAKSTVAGSAQAWVIVALVVIGVVIGLRGHNRRLGLALSLPVPLVVLAYRFVFELPRSAWYWSLPAYCLAMTAAVGLDGAVRTIFSRRAHLPVATVFAAIVAVVSLAGISDARSSSRHDSDDIGGWLNANTGPDDTVTAFEIGRIAWASNRSMIDPLGLLDGQSREFLRRGDFTAWLSATQPDYWVLSRSFLDSWLRGSPCLVTSFREVHATPFFTVFERTGPVPDDGTCWVARTADAS